MNEDNGYFSEALSNRQYGIKNKRSKKVVALVLAIIIIALTISVSFAYYNYEAPVRTSKEFITYVQDNNSSEAYKIFSDASKKLTSKETFTKMVDQVSSVLTGDTKEINREIVDSTDKDSKAKMQYEIEGSDGLKYEITIELIKKDSKWLVDDFSSESGPSKVGNNFVGFMQASDIDSAYKLLSSNSKKTIILENISDTCQIVDGKAALISRNGNNTSASITYGVPGKNSSTYKLVVNLIVENDEWKVKSFDCTLN